MFTVAKYGSYMNSPGAAVIGCGILIVVGVLLIIYGVLVGETRKDTK